jgi:hypothetical protein
MDHERERERNEQPNLGDSRGITSRLLAHCRSFCMVGEFFRGKEVGGEGGAGNGGAVFSLLSDS